ncbi:CU044_5270 family protein [Planobispora takensis]|uniref:CU044_5270 family protein n=1 Tax=Planobispora takensis TaxID=1367882 RepID=A0A8J3SWY7_9ACTN|nr:CU044_5270 family protein [Planobispora takensis]GII02012.1 hypothetical protein Pta02_40200 [Planobispora takensis]
MDDLETLRGMRAEAPRAEADRLRPARDRLLTEAAAVSAGRGRARRAWRRSGGRGAVMRRRSIGRAGVVLAGALALVTAVALVVAQAGGRSGGEGGTAHGGPPQAVRYADKAVVLEQAALVAGSRSTASEPRPDQWLYRKYVVRQPGQDSEPRVFEEWTRYDGRQRAGYDPMGRFEVTDVPPDPGDDDLSPEAYAGKLRKLPRDPDKLLAHVRGDRHWIDLPAEEAHLTEDPDVRAFRVLSLYLEQAAYLGQAAAMPPKLEAAIYRAMARIPGVGVALDVRDAVGRPGIGVFHTPAGQPLMREYLVLQPETFRCLGSSRVWLRDERIGSELVFPSGSVYSSAETASAIVDRPGERS